MGFRKGSMGHIFNLQATLQIILSLKVKQRLAKQIV